MSTNAYVYWLTPPDKKCMEKFVEMSREPIEQLQKAVLEISASQTLYPEAEFMRSVFPINPQKTRVVFVLGNTQFQEECHVNLPKSLDRLEATESIHVIRLPLLWKFDTDYDTYVGLDYFGGGIVRALRDYYAKHNPVVWVTPTAASWRLLYDLEGVQKMPWVANDEWQKNGMRSVNSALRELQETQWKKTKKIQKNSKLPKPRFIPINL